MTTRTVTPPPGSTISVVSAGETPVIAIPHPSGGVTRFLTGAFLLFWLGAWSVGLFSATNQVLSGSGGLFLIFWLGGWTVDGAFAVSMLYRMFRPAVPETLKLGTDGITYDAGVPPFRHDFSTASRQGAWASYFPKRTVVTIGRKELRSLRLRETETHSRLTVDVESSGRARTFPPVSI